jgi:hypothetical protein
MRNRLPAVVLDAKYKDPADGKPDDDDLYQIVAYCAGLGTHRAFLVHATTAASSTLVIESGAIEITVTGVDLAAPLPALRAQQIAPADAIACEPLRTPVVTMRRGDTRASRVQTWCVARTCRDAVLDAFTRLERRCGSRDFPLAEIVTETLARDPQFAESTVRTHVTSRMCASAPDHHPTTYPDLERLGRGRYRRR